MELYAALRSSALAKCQSSNSESKGYVAVWTNEALNLGCLWIKVVREAAKGQPQSRYEVITCTALFRRAWVCILLEKYECVSSRV